MNGVKYEKTHNSSSTNPLPRGSKVRLKYNPNDPTDVIWVTDASNILFPIVGLILGIMVLNSNKGKSNTAKTFGLVATIVGGIAVFFSFLIVIMMESVNDIISLIEYNEYSKTRRLL